MTVPPNAVLTDKLVEWDAPFGGNALLHTTSIAMAYLCQDCLDPITIEKVLKIEDGRYHYVDIDTLKDAPQILYFAYPAYPGHPNYSCSFCHKPIEAAPVDQALENHQIVPIPFNGREVELRVHHECFYNFINDGTLILKMEDFTIKGKARVLTRPSELDDYR